MKMALIRNPSWRQLVSSDRMPSMLVSLGLPREEVYKARWKAAPTKYGHKRGFWDRDPWELQDLLKKAGKHYRRLVCQVHPDKSGDHNAVILLNACWSRVKHLFAKHGITL